MPISTRISSELPFEPFRRRIHLDPRTPFLQRDKQITTATAARFEAGISHHSAFLRDTVAVRLHDTDGHLLGYCGRRRLLNEVVQWGTWRLPRGMPKHRLVYNAHRVAGLRPQGLVVVEDPWSVMRLHQAGLPGAVALLGCAASDHQLAWLSEASRIVLLDGDHAGHLGARTLAQKLHHHRVPTSVHDLQDGLDPDDLTDTELAALAAALLPPL